MIVVDASVAVKWFVQEDGHLPATQLLEHGLAIMAPDLIFPKRLTSYGRSFGERK